MSGKYLTRTIKTALVAVFTFQLLSTVERQVFDFLGYMWAPIIGNFFQIIAVILGLFGACQHYRSFVVVYAVWNILWLGWNIFVICLYLEVGILNRNRGRYILTMGTESKSWWLEHGIGCSVINSSWLYSPPSPPPSPPGRSIPPEESVQGCIMQYYYVEVIHAAVQVLLAMAGVGVALTIVQTWLEADDAGQYLVSVRTYARPTHPLSSSSSSHHHQPPPLSSFSSGGEGGGKGGGGGGYQRVATRDSWCLPTYVSYHQSMEWSSSLTHDHPHLHPPSHPPLSSSSSPPQPPPPPGAPGGEDLRRSTGEFEFESSGSLSSATTQPYLRLNSPSSDQVLLMKA